MTKLQANNEMITARREVARQEAADQAASGWNSSPEPERIFPPETQTPRSARSLMDGENERRGCSNTVIFVWRGEENESRRVGDISSVNIQFDLTSYDLNFAVIL